MGKINTKIPQLDKLLSGGIEKGTISCIWSSPGLDSSAFLYQIASNIVKTSKVFYIINSKSPQNAKEEIKSLKFNFSKVKFIDSYSSLIGAKNDSDLIIANPKDSDEVIKDINSILKKFKDPVIIIDSLSNQIDISEEENTKLLSKLKETKATIICSFTEWPYNIQFINKIKLLIDTIIKLSPVQHKLFSRQFFGVSKLNGKKITLQAYPFRIEKPGGVKIYIPKILVTGPFSAGKTSFIHSASVRAVSVDRLGTTIALDHGHVKYNDFSVDLFGTPGQQRFDPILKILGGDAFGVIIVISVIDPQGFSRALEMIKKADVLNIPIVVAANKSNLKGAKTPAQVKAALGLTDVPIIPITAKDLTKVQPGLPCQIKESDIKLVLDALFNKIITDVGYLKTSKGKK